MHKFIVVCLRKCTCFTSYFTEDGDGRGTSTTAILGGVSGVVVNIFLWIIMMVVVILIKKRTKVKKGRRTRSHLPLLCNYHTPLVLQMT